MFHQISDNFFEMFHHVTWTKTCLNFVSPAKKEIGISMTIIILKICCRNPLFTTAPAHANLAFTITAPVAVIVSSAVTWTMRLSLSNTLPLCAGRN